MPIRLQGLSPGGTLGARLEYDIEIYQIPGRRPRYSSAIVLAAFRVRVDARLELMRGCNDNLAILLIGVSAGQR
jgi:hypothetical protein